MSVYERMDVWSKAHSARYKQRNEIEVESAVVDDS